MTDRRLFEARGTLAPKGKDGLYPVTIITEGDGTTGRYSRELLEHQAATFSDSLSFMDHPADPARPWERSVTSIGGRIVGETSFVEEDGVAKVKGWYKPDARWADFVEEYADALGLSIFIGAKGEELPDGRLNVTEFLADDPYKSVDVVVAAGRGGKFDRANEAKRLIEASLAPQGERRSADPAGEKEKEMTPEEIKSIAEAFTAAIAEKLAPVIDFVNEQKQAAEAAKGDEPTVEQAVEAYAAAAAKVAEAKLLPSQEGVILAAAKRGEDVAPLIESAKSIKDEAVKFISESEDGVYGRRHEGSAKDEDYSVGGEW